MKKCDKVREYWYNIYTYLRLGKFYRKQYNFRMLEDMRYEINKTKNCLKYECFLSFNDMCKLEEYIRLYKLEEWKI